MAEMNDILEVAKTTINASVNCNTVRGYIGWHSCNNICMDMYDVLDMCENAFQQGRFLDVLEVATYVLVSGVKLASYADSSSGMLTDVIMCTFELIGVCAQTIAKETMEMRTKAFSLIIKESKKKAFEGWSSWRYELIDKAICLCDEKMAMKFEKVLDVFLENDTDVYMPEYNKREDMILRYQLHRHIKGADAVKDELYANLHIEELRVIAVKDALNEKQYQEAERLCLEQIKDDDWRYYKNDPDDWNNILFDVFVQAGQIDKQVDQAKKILFLGNEEFWDVLKKLYQSQNAWETQRQVLLEELKNSKHTTCYRSVLIEEDEKGLLLEAVSEKPIDLFYYSQFLVEDYPEEIYALCEDYIRGKCAEATDRRLYKRVCKDLLQLIKWKGNTTAKALVEEFKATVLYGSASELRATLDYDFSEEKKFSYKGLTMDEIIHHLAFFVSRLWQIHIFAEGNTRTTAVFFIKYLRTLGFDATNDIFAEYAWYFRNALVRANYNDLKNGIHETTEYLELFLRNLLLDEENELHNRSMHISGLFDKKVDIQSAKVDIGSKKVDIEDVKVDIRQKLLSSSSKVTNKTVNHVLNIFLECGKDVCFGRTMVEDITGLKTSGASKLIKLLVDSDVITPVIGQGKGKYRFR